MPPTSDQQILFLVNLQRLLDEGSFVASYRFALLLALADLCIENGDDSGAPMAVNTADIAEKFITYYWRQAVPYPSPVETTVLRQNAGKQAAIVNAVRDARAAYGDSLPNLMKNMSAWRPLVSRSSGCEGDAPPVSSECRWRAAGFSVRRGGPCDQITAGCHLQFP